MAYCIDCGYCEHGPCVDDCGQVGGYVCLGPRARRERARHHADCEPQDCVRPGRFCPVSPPTPVVKQGGGA